MVNIANTSLWYRGIVRLCNLIMDKVYFQIAFLLLGFEGSTISDEQYTYQVGVHT